MPLHNHLCYKGMFFEKLIILLLLLNYVNSADIYKNIILFATEAALNLSLSCHLAEPHGKQTRVHL